MPAISSGGPAVSDTQTVGLVIADGDTSLEVPLPQSGRHR
jgi:hypothetical protein